MLSRKLSSLSAISTYTSLSLYENKCIDNNNALQVRKLWTFSPLCMGRRSSKIAGRKVLSLAQFFFWLWIISLGTDYNGVLLVCAHWLNDLFGKVLSMICNFMCLMKCLIEVRCFTSILIWVLFFGIIFLLEHHVFDAMSVSIIMSLEKLGRHFCGLLLQVSKCDSKCRGHKMQRRQSYIRGLGRKSYLRELVTLYLTLSWIDMQKLLKREKKKKKHKKSI